MMSQQYFQISPIQHKEPAGYWIVDKNGSIKERSISEGTIFQSTFPGTFQIDSKKLKNYNVYLLQVKLQFVRLIKQRISNAKVYVLGPLKRDSEVEARLLLRFRESLLDQLQSGVIDQSGGIDKIIQSLKWEESSPFKL